MKKGFTTFLSALKANTPPCKKGHPSLRFLSLFLILFLAVGNVWADTQTYSFASSAELNNLTYTPGNASDTWNVCTAKTNNVEPRGGGFVQYKCAKSSTKATFVTKESFDNITNISFFIASSDKGKTQVKIEVSSEADFSSDVTEIVNTTGGLSGLGISSPANNTWYSVSKSVASKSGYVRFTMTASSSGKYWSFDDIVITYTPSSGGDPVCPSGLTISSKDSKTAFLEGDAIELTAALSEGNGAITYQWYKGGTAEGNKLAGKTAAKLEIASCVEGDAGDYYCVASKADCSDAVNATAFAITVAHNPCATYFWFFSNADQTTNGKTNATSVFSNMVGGGSDLSGSITIDETTYNVTRRTGDADPLGEFTVPANKAATFYALAVSSGDAARKIVLTNTTTSATYEADVAGGKTSYKHVQIDNIAPGTYSIGKSGGNTRLGMVALKVCDAIFHTITFNSNGGSTVADLSVLDGTTATQPTDPTWEHHRFDGWYNGSDPYDWTANVTGDLTLTAHWTQLYTITYAAGDGTATGDAPTQVDKAEGETFTVAANTFEVAGKDFAGWLCNIDAHTYQPGDEYEMTAAATTFTAQWKAETPKYDVTYNLNGGTGTAPTQPSVAEGATVTLAEAPIWEGYRFDGWLVKDENGNDVTITDGKFTMPAAKVAITAQWTKVYVPQGANYVFENTATLGTAPNAITVTKDNKTNAIAANSRIDNMWLSAMSVKLEDGTYSGSGDDFKGWKINTSAATIRFFVENDSRVTVTVGNLSSGMNIAYTGTDDAAHDEGLSAKNANAYNVKGGTLVTLTTQGGNTVTLKGIAVSKIPDKSDDATLSDLKVGSTTISGFSASKLDYYIELPYGSTSQPVVTATPHDDKAVGSVTQTIESLEDAVITVTAENGTTTKVYRVHFTVAPKDGTCIVKADLAAGSSAASITATSGAYKDADNIAINVAKDLKLGSNGAYVKVAVKDTYFQDGDVVEIVLRTDKSASAWLQIFADEGTTLVAEMKSGVSNATPNHLTISGVPENTSALYLYRTEAADGDMNPYPTSMAVYRAINPILKAITINGEAGIINESAKTVAVELQPGYDLAALTIVPTIVSNTAEADVVKTVESNGGAWVIGDNTYRLTDKDGDYTDYTITLSVGVLKHTVSFNTHGGSTIDDVEVEDGQKLTAAPADPTREDYLFQGWAETEDGSIVDVTSFTISADKEFHAVWAPDGAIKLLDGATVNHTNYITGVTADETVEFKGNEVHYAKFNGTVSGVNGVKDLTRVIAYNATTNKTKIQISAHNNKTDARNILVKGLVEGASEVVDLATIALGNKEDKISDWIEFNNAANRTIYIFVPSSAGDVYFTQVKVIESGETQMKMAGEAGYSLNFNKGRFFGVKGVTAHFEGLDVEVASSDCQPLSTTVVKLASSSISFDVAVPVTLTVTTNNDKTYYVTEGAAGTDNETAKTGATDFDLTAGTWYITGGASNVEITNIAFSAPKCEQPTVVDMENIDLCEGDAFTALTVSASVTDGGTLHYQWYKHPAEGDDEAVGTDAATYTPTADGQYYVIVTNKLADHSDNSKASNMVTVEHFASAVITTAPANQCKEAGQNATLTVVATGKNVTYQWYTCKADGTNATEIGGATAASYEVTVGTGVQYYKVVVSSDCGTPVEAVVKVEEWTELPQANVTGSRTWDWAAESMGEIATESGSVEYLMANVSSQVPNTEAFRSDMLYITANYANRGTSNKFFQGWQIRFYTEVPGKVSLNCRAIHGTMSITINGIVIDDAKGSDMGTATTPFFVPAGWVTIVFDNQSSGYEGEAARVQKIVFNATPDYIRDVRQGYYGTICLPNGGVMVGATLFELSYYNEAQGLLYMDEADATMVAGNPYIFLPNEGADKLAVFYTDEDNASAGSKNGLVGYLDNEDMQLEGDGTNYILKDNKIKKVVGGNNSNVFVTKNRAYIKLGAVNPNESALVPGRRRVAIGQAPQVATGMENVDASAQPVKTIINGQLFILRGEKMYDAQGKLVK